METPSQTHQSLPAPAPPRPPADDAVSSRLAALKARLAAEKSKSSSRQPDQRRRVVPTAATSSLKARRHGTFEAWGTASSQSICMQARCCIRPAGA